MIVNPQLFNYRLIIGTLLIAIVVFGSFSYSKYHALKNHQEFIEQENVLVQNELNEMIKSYEATKRNNKTVEQELKETKATLFNVLDSLSVFSTNVSVISKYKNQLANLNREKSLLLNKIELANNESQFLEAELFATSQQFLNQQKQLHTLEEENSILNKQVEKMTSVSAVNVNAVALNTVSPISDLKTNKIANLDHIEVCLTLLSNEFTPRENKHIFVQLIGPDNRLVVEKGRVKFNEIPLDYSGMTVVNNNYNNIDVCTKINVETKEALKKGVYNVLIYNDDLQIGRTELELN